MEFVSSLADAVKAKTDLFFEMKNGPLFKLSPYLTDFLLVKDFPLKKHRVHKMSSSLLVYNS